MELLGVYFGLRELVVVSLGLAMGGAFGYAFFKIHHQ